MHSDKMLGLQLVQETHKFIFPLFESLDRLIWDFRHDIIQDSLIDTFQVLSATIHYAIYIVQEVQSPHLIIEVIKA